MSIQGVVYLVNKNTQHISYAGPVPATYGRITGLSDVDYSTLRDLTMFGEEFVGLGFLTEQDALDIGCLPESINQAKVGAWELGWNGLEVQRQDLIEDQRWRVNRFNDESMLELPHTEDIIPVLQYMQAIRDLPTAFPDPFNIVWPVIPALPTAAT